MSKFVIFLGVVFSLGAWCDESAEMQVYTRSLLNRKDGTVVRVPLTEIEGEYSVGGPQGFKVRIGRNLSGVAPFMWQLEMNQGGRKDRLNIDGLLSVRREQTEHNQLILQLEVRNPSPIKYFYLIEIILHKEGMLLNPVLLSHQALYDSDILFARKQVRIGWFTPKRMLVIDNKKKDSELLLALIDHNATHKNQYDLRVTSRKLRGQLEDLASDYQHEMIDCPAALEAPKVGPEPQDDEIREPVFADAPAPASRLDGLLGRVQRGLAAQATETAVAEPPDDFDFEKGVAEVAHRRTRPPAPGPSGGIAASKPPAAPTTRIEPRLELPPRPVVPRATTPPNNGAAAIE